jgi:exodeoxyribonuclease V alpha subunit
LTRNEEKAATEPDDALEGRLDRFTFRNAETGFAVARFVPDGDAPAVTIVGQLAQLAEGQHLRVTGERKSHPRFGVQIEVTTVEAVLPTNKDGLIAYLGSGLVKGIGPATAERIVAAFGETTLEVIESAPDRLLAVRGLGRRKLDDLVAAVRSQRDVQEVLVFLRAHGLGQALAGRIVKRLGRNASALIQANPYRLADEVIGVGFRTADRLALRLGLAADAAERIDAGLLHVLAIAARDGHCYLDADDLGRRTAELLEIDETAVHARIPELERSSRIVRDRIEDNDALYPVALLAAERGCADAVLRLLAFPPLPVRLDFERALDDFAAERDITLPSGQREAVERAFRHSISVITGGPGVGKTTTVRAIAALAARANLALVLAAPTGRAAKRLEESTAVNARTVHRLLEFQPGLGRFLRDAEHPLEGDVLVVDETSMLDVQLAYNLLRAVRPGMRLVIVGDIDQLPSVGAGAVLSDLIGSGAVPVTRLSTIFRQGSGSRIVEAAHAIRGGEVPTTGSADDDFFIVSSKTPTHAREIIRELVTARIPRRFGLDPVRDVQVLCPMYRGDAGADALNLDLQTALNPNGEEFVRGGRAFRIGDKVMQVKNDYDLDVYNGDVGFVRGIDRTTQTLLIRFDERTIEYPFADSDQLVPAYAITIHRSQGSEYPAVVIPVLTEHFVMLARNLLYTAVTRGRKLVVIVGTQNALELAVGNSGDRRRNTALAARLRAGSGR